MSTRGLHKLPLDGVQIYLISTLQLPEQINHFTSFLSKTEIDRLHKYRFEKDKNAFAIGRGWLRVILAFQINTSPESIGFRYGIHGKPLLSNTSELYFNLSNSGDLIAIAITRRSDIGVDLEYKNPDMDHDSVSRTVFSRPEMEYLDKSLGDQKIDRFFELWTRKEAFIKALGYGFSMPIDLKEIDVLGQQIEFIKNSPGHELVIDPDWALYSFEPEPGYKAAISLRNLPVNISYHKDQEIVI